MLLPAVISVTDHYCSQL